MKIIQKIKKVNLLAFLLLLLFYSNFSFSQGLQLAEPELIDEAEKLDLDNLGFTETDPPARLSLIDYAPPVRNQSGGTCVGWATTYSAMSIMYNIQNNITDPFIKWATAFDPYFIYTISKTLDKDPSCDDGMYVADAIKILAITGAKKWSIGPFLSCDDRWNEDAFDRYAKNNSVPYRTSSENYGVIPFINSSQYIEDTKKAISVGIPVVIGVNLTESFRPRSENENYGIGSDGLWEFTEGEESVGGHAMTIIGYDDYRNGGSIQVMNSWGEDFGDNGFVWIKYDDYIKTTVDYYEGEAYGQAYWFTLDFDRLDFNNNPVYFGNAVSRVILSNDITYDGQLSTEKWIDYRSDYDGLGQLIFKDGSVYSGPFINGKYNGTGLFFDYEDKKMIMVEYSNGEFIDSETLGFSEEASESSEELRNYLDIFDPKVKIQSVSDDPLESSFENILKIKD